MSPNSVLCRICLSGKVHMIPIAGTPLQHLYEKLINTLLYTADNRPVKVCYICHALLKRCYDLMLTASKAENILTSVLQKYPEGYPGLETVIGEHASNLCITLETIPVDCIDFTSFSEPMFVKSEPPDTNDIPGCDVKDEVEIDIVEDFPRDPYVQPPNVKAEDGIMEYINVLASQETGLVLNTAQVVSTPLSETCLPSTFQPSIEDGSDPTIAEDTNSTKRPPVIRLGESPRCRAMETDEKDIMEEIGDNKKNRKYKEAKLRTAVKNVLEKNLSVYRTSKELGIPWTTLKGYVRRAKEERDKGIATQSTMSKIGRPFSLQVEPEQQLVAYIIEMQERGFNLRVKQILKIVNSSARNNKQCFNLDNIAGLYWWSSFKQRYGLSLRTRENSSAGRTDRNNPSRIADFYEKLEKTLIDHDLLQSPDKIWNCDETGLGCMNGVSKILSYIGKQYLYSRRYDKRTVALLAAINAVGCFLPPMTIFNGERNVPQLYPNSFPNNLIRLAPKGRMNAGLFLEWLEFFSKIIPPGRPVLLIMDSRASYVSPRALAYAKSNGIILLAMPAHTIRVQHPIDIGVYQPLKEAWHAELQKYKTQHPTSAPTRFEFHNIFNPAFERSSTPSNIVAGFEKTGIYPLNKTAVCSESIEPNRLTDKLSEPIQEIAGFKKIGIYPLNKTAVCSESIEPSRLTDKLTEPIQEIEIKQDFEDP